MKGKPGQRVGGTRGRVRTEIAIQIGKATREARLKLKLTQEDVAERVGITGEVYGRLERGDMVPSTPTLLKLRTALGVSSDFLVGLANDAQVEGSQAPPAPEKELTPEIRRLLRLLRTMDDEQLAIFKGTATGFAKLNKRRQQSKRDKSQVAVT